MNVNNNNREYGVKTKDGIKTEDWEWIGNVCHRYSGDEYKNIIANIFKYGLMDGDLHLTNFNNQHLALTNTV